LYGKKLLCLVLLRMRPNPTFRSDSLFIRTSSIMRCLSRRHLQRNRCHTRKNTPRIVKDPRRAYGHLEASPPKAASFCTLQSRAPPGTLSCSTRRCVTPTELRKKAGGYLSYFHLSPRLVGRCVATETLPRFPALKCWATSIGSLRDQSLRGSSLALG